VKGLLGKVETICRTEGLRSAVAKALLGSCRRAVRYSRSEFIVSEMELTTESRVSLKVRLVVRVLELQDRAAVAAFHRRHEVDPRQQDRVANYFDHGYRGFLAFDEGELIGYLFWVNNESPAAHRNPHLRLFDIRLKDDEIYGFDFYVAPRHRGESRALEFFDRAARLLAEDGYSKIYGFVDAEKRPARWTYALLGLRPIRTLIAHKFFRSVVVLNGRVFLAKKYDFS
jgi:GNAT superfamily N-acetyltransferase